MSKYLSRVIDKELDLALRATSAVLIEGPKWCGKTSSGLEKAASVLYMQDPDTAQANLRIADTKPSLLLKGDTPRLIDEWQVAPVLWDAVRHIVDQRSAKGQFILTGSATPTDDGIMHTGTGRISRVLMRPMSLYESLESSGDVSLKELFDGKTDISGINNIDIEKMAYLIVRGGWPQSIGEEETVAMRTISDYISTVLNHDVSRVDGVKKNPVQMEQLMRSLARNITTIANMTTIRNDMLGDDDTITERTISKYMNALRRIFLVEDVTAWNPSLRSKTAIRTSPKRQFVDPSIATGILGLSKEGLLKDFNLYGFMFESLCTRDIRIYAQSIDGKVYHYRDRSGLESDLVVTLRDGRWAAIEVKLGNREIEKAAENLLKLKDRIDLNKMNEPTFLMILTCTEYAYRREDGVFVVPIGCLKP